MKEKEDLIHALSNKVACVSYLVKKALAVINKLPCSPEKESLMKFYSKINDHASQATEAMISARVSRRKQRLAV